MHAILKKLQGGDRRSIGRVDEVVDSVLGSSALFEELINGLFADVPILRMRTADAVEKVTRVRPELLAAHKKALIQKPRQKTAPRIDGPVAGWKRGSIGERKSTGPPDRDALNL